MKLKKCEVCQRKKSSFYLLNKRGIYCSRECYLKQNKDKRVDRVYEYILRIIKPKQENSTEVYGITISPRYVRKYDLLGKKFKVRVSPMGKFILYTKLK